MSPTKIMIIRHGEKPDDRGDPPFGVTFDGTEDKDSLIVQGWERAGALGRLFVPFGGAPPRANLAVPGCIYAAGADGASKSVRSEKVVSVVRGLLPDVPYNDSFVPDQYKAAAKSILEQTGTVLVAWEHHAIKHLVRHITGRKGLAPHWSGDRFDVVLVLDQEEKGWTLTQAFQMLLPGDSTVPLPPATAADMADLDQESGDGGSVDG